MTEAIPASAEGIARAAAMLRDGRLVAFGTETVYGLGADATRASSVARVFDAKGRPHFNPLIAHVRADAEAAGCSRLYWLTHESNTDAMALYDKVAERSGFVQYRVVL